MKNLTYSVDETTTDVPASQFVLDPSTQTVKEYILSVSVQSVAQFDQALADCDNQIKALEDDKINATTVIATDDQKISDIQANKQSIQARKDAFLAQFPQ